jgi:hypothetical protein
MHCIRSLINKSHMNQNTMPEAPEQNDETLTSGDQRQSRIPWIVTGALTLLFAFGALELRSIREQVSELKAFDKRLQEMSQAVGNQSHLINRALGVMIPITVPEEIEEKLSELERVMLNESNWPLTADDVKKISDDFAGLVSTMPPWVQEELLPRIVPRRWELEALLRLRQDSPSGPEAMAQFSDEILVLYTDYPKGVSEKLVTELQRRRVEVEEKFDELERLEALKYAHAAMAGNGDLNEAALRLARYDEADADVAPLKIKLIDAATRSAFESEVATLEADFQRFEKIKDESLRDYALMRAQQAIMDIKLRLSAPGKADESLVSRIEQLDQSLSSKLRAVSAARADAQQEMYRKYQAWALSEIKKVPTYSSLENIEIQKLDVFDRNNPLSSARKRAERVAQDNIAHHLIDRMAHIDQRLLDEAVAIWFRKVYQDRFNNLDESRQLRVVESFATAGKHPLAAGQ